MRWKPMLRFGTVLSAAVLVATACGDQEDLGGGGEGPEASVAEGAEFEPGTTMAELQEAGTITVGTKFDQPLFGQQGLDGELSGFDVEIAQIIAGALGIAEDGITFEEAPSAQREELIEQGTVDMVVATYTINDERRQRVTFAGPYYQAGQTLMVREDDTEITGPDVLRDLGTRVCSVQGSTPAENILEYIEPSQLTTFDVYTKCVDALRTNQVDAVTTDNVILLGYISENEGEFKLAGDLFTEEPYGIGIERGNTEFCDFINDTLTEADESGAYQDAWEATAGTTGEPVPTLPEPDPCT